MFRCVITKPRKEVDLDKLRELAEKGHTKEMIAAGLGMSYDALNERQNENPKIREIIREARMIPAALGVDAILEGMRKGDISAAKFFLERRCGWRNETKTTHDVNVRVDVKSLDVEAAAIALMTQRKTLEIDITDDVVELPANAHSVAV